MDMDSILGSFISTHLDKTVAFSYHSSDRDLNSNWWHGPPYGSARLAVRWRPFHAHRNLKNFRQRVPLSYNWSNLKRRYGMSRPTFTSTIASSKTNGKAFDIEEYFVWSSKGPEFADHSRVLWIRILTLRSRTFCAFVAPSCPR